jgi:peptidyl-prolyl cis-trans isomerase SurA
MKKTFLILIFTTLLSQLSFSQEGKVIDQVVAVVGNRMIMLSDIENQYAQYIMQGYKGDSTIKCVLLEDLLFQKLLLNQADIDSVTVTDSQVETELDRRIRYFASQIGSEEKLAAYYNKSIIELKNEFRTIIKDQLLQQTMEGKITENVKITPTEVRNFFNAYPKDSIPLVSSVVEVGQIVKQPAVSQVEIDKVKEKLNGYRDRILKGEEFSTLAVMYSEDETSAVKGGELGFTSRGDLVPEFEAAAYSLNVGEVSPIVKTKFGYHIIKLIERRGETINVQHILLKPKVAIEDLSKAKLYLDSVYTLIKKDTIPFEKACAKFSDDASAKAGGLLINTETGTTKFEPDQLDPSVFFSVDKMKVGDMSLPVPMKTADGLQAYRILYLKSRTEPHKANLKEDYDLIQEAAKKDKETKTITTWVDKKIANCYVHILDEFKDCKYVYKWF